ncbi:hypothetical protein [Nitrososphaera sp.]|uniref:hypothetical protein n=1 Tax=Nitrososphaera sp. TaxID=1971748 RepID=UPI002EDAD1D7
MSKPKMRMPGAARAGVGLLVVGGLIVGIGTYMDRGVMSLYGLAMVAGGFVLYMAASMIAKRQAR